METDTRAQVWAKTNGYCWYCGKLMNPWSDFTVDHMDPRKQGGGDELSNLVPCCKSCNSQKHAKTVEEFRQYLQGKAEHRFWFEHVSIAIQTPLLHKEDVEEPSTDSEPDSEDFSEIIDACLFIGTHFNMPLTLLTFIALAVEWIKEPHEPVFYCDGWFDLEILSSRSGQAITTVLAHILYLQSRDLLSVAWQTAPHNVHDFSLNIGALLQATRELRRRAHQERTEG